MIPDLAMPDGVTATRWRRAAFTTASPILFQSGIFALAFAGLGLLINYLYFALTALLGLVLLIRNRRVEYVELCFSTWFFGAGLRRVVDWQSSFHDPSLILLAAPAVSLVGLFFCNFRRYQASRLTLLTFTIFGLLLLYGFLIGVLLNGPQPALVSLIGWFPPFALGTFVLLAGEDRRAIFKSSVDRSWIPLAILGLYGIIQWVFAPPWDTAWMKAVSPIAFTFGSPEPLEIRVFSLLNSPFPLGCILVVLLMAQISRPFSWLRLVASLSGFTALLLSEVRAAWILFVLILILLATRRRISFRLIFGGLAIATAAVLFAPAQLAETVSDRFATIDSGSSDVSFAARNEFYARALPGLLTDLTGRGMGSVGAGVRAAGTGADSTFRDADSSYIEALRMYGPIFGSALIVLTIVIAARTWSRLGGAPGPIAVGSASLLGVPFLALLGDVFSSANGAVVWFMVAACSSTYDRTLETGEAQ